MYTSGLLAVAAASFAATASAQVYGFNYGSTNPDGSVRTQAQFQALFEEAKGLVGTNGEFTSARFYTMIQGGTTNTPVEGIPAAIASNTQMLLGLWASAGQADFNNELAALQSAISQYGSQFASLVQGISVGSEDLYRDSALGIAANDGIGAPPDTIVSYIGQVRSAIAGTSLAKTPVGHVDTWNAWTNSSVSAVIEAVDFLGDDAYPYFQNTMPNAITSGQALFVSSLQQVEAVAQGKPVWITETGWPVSGPNSNLAVASVENAQTYWDEVGCQTLFGKYPTYWYTLEDAPVAPSFGIVGASSSTPLFNLSCAAAPASSSSSSASSIASSTSLSSTASSASVTSTSSASSSSVSSASAIATAGGNQGSPGLGALTASGSGSTTTGASTSSSAASPSGMATTVVSVSNSTGSSSGSRTATAPTASSTFAGSAAKNAGSMGVVVGAVAALVMAL